MYAEVTFSDGAWKQEIGKGKTAFKRDQSEPAAAGGGYFCSILDSIGRTS